jgi:hypothetical protein
MTRIDLDELERLARAATPGPWQAAGYSVTHEYKPGVSEAVAVSHIARPHDAAFIAAANPETVLALIRIAKAASEACSRLEDPVDTLIEVGNGTTDEMLHKAADDLLSVRDSLRGALSADGA